MEEILKIVGCIIITTIELYIISLILSKKINYKNYKNYKNYIYLVITIAGLIINNTFSSSFIKMLNATLILFLSAKLIFNDSNINTFKATILGQCIFVVAEMLIMSFVVVILEFNVEKIISKTSGSFLMNILISLTALVLIKFSFAYKFIQRCFAFNLDRNNKKSIFLTILAIISINLLIGSIYYKVNILVLMIINSLFISILMYFIYKNMEEQNKNILYKAENDALINNLSEYEKMADQHRVINHENKNIIHAINQMIENNEIEEVKQYISNLTTTGSIKKDKSLISKTKRIPSGGLQGIIYQKMLVMKENEIPYNLEISRDLKSLDFKLLGIKTNIDLCKIVGVFLDNAIEEVKTLDNKFVNIEIYVADTALCVSISNTYVNNKKFDKMDDIGKTTKGAGHGYGLSLVKQLLVENKRLINLREVKGRYFVQIIKVMEMTKK